MARRLHDCDGHLDQRAQACRAQRRFGVWFKLCQCFGCLLSAGIGGLVALIGGVLLSRVRASGGDENSIENVERVFGILMIFTACAMAFAHGSNDVANAVGPLKAVVSTVQSGGAIGETSLMPWWVLAVGAVGIVFGLSTYGWRVIQTIGRKITELTRQSVFGFAAELAAATTVVLASATGLPISTTHTVVGAVLGVGLARGVEALLHLPTIWARDRLVDGGFLAW